MHQTTAAAAAAAAVTRNSTTMHSTDTNNRNIEDHEDQASLISALSGEDVDVSLLAGENVAYHDDDDEAGCTLISNTSSNASNYFMTPHHKHADSLCYSSTSSPPPGSRKKGVPTSSYIASFGNSLGSQQAFPSSMFPGQKLLPPNSSKDPLGHEGAKDDSRRSHSNVPSYYYMSPPSSSEIPPNAASSSWQESYQNSGSGTFRHVVDTRSTIARFNSIQVSGSNVYQKRSTRSEFYDDDVSLPANWRAAMNCLFSPRVLATLLICAVILVNLLRVGNQGKHHRNHGSSTLRGSHVSADYVKLEAIGNTELWSLFDDDDDNDDDESPPPIDQKAFNKPRADHEEGGEGT